VDISAEWNSTIEEIVKDPGVAIVIGDTDTGKTTFVLELINSAVRAGVATAIVDADVGQGEVGPPAVVSMAMVEGPVERLRDLNPRRMHFVGSTTPYAHMLPLVVGTKKMTEEALARGAKLVVVDTTGLVQGAAGGRLKLHKIELLQPKHVVGISKKREIEHITNGISKIDAIKLHRLQSSPEVKDKSRELRTARRQKRFFDYFHGAERHIIRIDDIVCWNTFFTTGRSVKWQHYRVLERTLHAKILHAEVAGNGMYIVVHCEPNMAGVEALRNRYGTREFTVVCGTDFSNLLVGLADAHGNTIALGIVEAVDFKQRHIALLTPISTISPVRIIQFGSLRVRADGTELGTVKPGAI
jgi:polynucleotide 5'-hydroxyl-kinase GRC3/NOL9